MLGADLSGDRDGICGTVTSGGTESILLAMKTYRDRARAEQGTDADLHRRSQLL
jgi:glutamate/tyrosine decarboxylase-like PLP-dependent enzyme